MLALAAVIGSITVAAGIEMAALAAGPVQPRWLVVAIPCLAIGYGLVGIEAWRRRPSNRVGPLLVLGSWCWLLSGLADTGLPPLVPIGVAVATVGIAVIVHLILAFPSGRLIGTGSVLVTVGAYISTTVLQVSLFLFEPSPLMVADLPDLERFFTVLQGAVVLAVVFGLCLIVTQRIRAARTPARRVLLPLYLYGVVAVVFVPVTSVLFLPVLGLDPAVLAAVQYFLIAGIPFAFALGLLRGGFSRTGEVEELGARLGADLSPAELVDAVADALGDPSVEIAFWLVDQHRYVDHLGRPIGMSAERGFCEVNLAGRRIGGIGYDAALIGEPELVAMAGRMLALAVDRERLTVNLLINQDQLRESRSRLIDAADRERRRIARDLHDGLQGRLVLLAVRSELLVEKHRDDPTAIELRAGMDDAIDELRRLVHGVLPALLIERGFYAAAEELVDRMTIPTRLELQSATPTLPPVVESTAYFVVAEGLANVVKHSKASTAWVRLGVRAAELIIEIGDDGIGGASADRGSGLRGINDRMDVLGGRLVVDSSVGAGTRMRVELPCGS